MGTRLAGRDDAYDIVLGAHLPDVVPERALTQASSRLRASEATAMLIGPGLGGSLVQLITAPLAVLVDAVSFVASAVLVSRVRAPERVGHVVGVDFNYIVVFLQVVVDCSPSEAAYRGLHWCLNTALRLATKASMPSFWSAVANSA